MNYIWLILLALILLAMSAQPFFAEKRLYKYKPKQYIMTTSEMVLYRKLMVLYRKKYIVVPQVRLSSIFDEHIKGQNWKAALSHINQKSVDFLFLDINDFSIRFALELDDSTHDKEGRRIRDNEVNRIFLSSNIPLVHLRNVNYKDCNFIKNAIDKQLYSHYT